MSCFVHTMILRIHLSYCLIPLQPSVLPQLVFVPVGLCAFNVWLSIKRDALDRQVASSLVVLPKQFYVALSTYPIRQDHTMLGRERWFTIIDLIALWSCWWARTRCVLFWKTLSIGGMGFPSVVRKRGSFFSNQGQDSGVAFHQGY